MKIAFIPIDNRPVCYNLAKEIAAIDNNLELILPDRNLLGGLTSSADIEGLFRWIEHVGEVDAYVISLDTIAHGGLISSRRSKEGLGDIKKRLERLKSKLNGKVYAFSSVMRISNNNVNEEEKSYWSEYGTKIFEYSYNFHKDCDDRTDVPEVIINDYLITRNRNFQINKMYIDWLEEGLFDTLVFSKDDCAEFGLNVMEAGILEDKIKAKNLENTGRVGLVKTGADEIPLTLLARAVVEFNNTAPKICPKFLAPEFKSLISNYEDISIAKSVSAQIELAGCEITNEDSSDIVMLVNNFEELQGEIVMGVKTAPFSSQFNLPKKPYLIADVRFANGADNVFVEKLFKKNIDISNFYGFSAWNTSANTLGSLICAGVVRFFAQDFNEQAFRKLQMVRFLDDWAYQANVRQALKGKPSNGIFKSNRPDVRKLTKLMAIFEKKLEKILEIKSQIKYKFPWKRFFEVEVMIK